MASAPIESMIGIVEDKSEPEKPVDREKNSRLYPIVIPQCIPLLNKVPQLRFAVLNIGLRLNYVLKDATCPLLLRVFCNTGRHHNILDYRGGNVPANELQIYTWMDATLREITSLVKEVNPEARRKGTYFDFSLVFPDIRSPGYRMREIGTTCSGQKGSDDGKTLAQARFCIGDYMDISITPPNRMVPMMRRGGRPY